VPTYEYQCEKCSHRFEASQSIKDAPLAECPRCGGRIKRLIGGGVGFLFKGSGFYSTDYRSASYRKRAKEESGTKAAGEGKGAPPAKPEKPSPPQGGGEGGGAGGSGGSA